MGPASHRHPGERRSGFSTAVWLVIQRGLAVVVKAVISCAVEMSFAHCASHFLCLCKEGLYNSRMAGQVTKESTPYGTPNDEAVGFASALGIFVRRIPRLRKRRTSLCAALRVYPSRLPCLTGFERQNPIKSRQTLWFLWEGLKPRQAQPTKRRGWLSTAERLVSTSHIRPVLG